MAENNNMETPAPTLVAVAASTTEPSNSGCLDDPNFATICSFMEKFGETCRIDAFPFAELQEMIENTTEVALPLVQLHIRLLRRVFKSIATDKWERSLAKFGHTYCSQDGWEIERFGYKKAKIQTKLRLLKNLLESQFDYNIKFKAEVNKIPATDLRLIPMGRDTEGQLYWYQVDSDANLRVYREDVDDETWEIVASSREEMVELISQLQRGEVKKPIVADDEVVAEEDANEKEIEPKEILLDTGKIEEEPSDDEMDEEPDWKEDDSMSIDDEGMEIDEDYVAPEQIVVDTTIKCNSTIDNSDGFNNVSDSFSLREEKFDISTKSNNDVEIREFESYKTVTTIGSEKENFDKNDPKVEPLRLKKEKHVTEKVEKIATKEQSVQDTSETQVNKQVCTSTERVMHDKIETPELKSETAEALNNKVDFPTSEAPLFKKDDNIQNLKPECVPATKDEIKSSSPNKASFENETEQPLLLSSENNSSPDEINTEPISIKVSLNINPIPEISNVNALIIPTPEKFETHSHVKSDSGEFSSSQASTLKSIIESDSESDQTTPEPLVSTEPIPVSVELSISISAAIPSTKLGHNVLETLIGSDTNVSPEVVQDVLPISVTEKSLEKREEKEDSRNSVEVTEPTPMFTKDNMPSSFVSNYRFNDHHTPVPHTVSYGEVETLSQNIERSPAAMDIPKTVGNQITKAISVSRPSLDLDEIDSDDDAMEIAEDVYPEDLSKDAQDSSNEPYKYECPRYDKVSLPIKVFSSEQISNTSAPAERNTDAEEETRKKFSVNLKSLSGLSKGKATLENILPNLPFNYKNLHALPEENKDLLIKDVYDKEGESAGKYKQQDVPGKHGSMTELLSSRKADDVITETSVTSRSSTGSELVGDSNNTKIQHEVRITKEDLLSKSNVNVSSESSHAYLDSVSCEVIPITNKISFEKVSTDPPNEGYSLSINIHKKISPNQKSSRKFGSQKKISDIFPESGCVKKDIFEVLSSTDDKPKEINTHDNKVITTEIYPPNINSRKEVSSVNISISKEESANAQQEAYLDSAHVPKVVSDVEFPKPGFSENIFCPKEHSLENVDALKEVCTTNIDIPKSKNYSDDTSNTKEDVENIPKMAILEKNDIAHEILSENNDKPKEVSLESITPMGVSSENITPMGVSSENITPMGVSSENITPMGFFSKNITQKGVSSENITPIGVSSENIAPMGFSSKEITPMGVSSENITPMGVSSEDIAPMGFSSKEITQMGVSSENITPMGVSSENIAPMGFSSKEITPMGVSSENIAPMGFSSKDITPMGVSSENITPMGVSSENITPIGVSSENITPMGVSSENITPMGVSSENITPMGISSENITPMGVSSENITPMGFSSKNIVTPMEVSSDDITPMGVSSKNIVTPMEVSSKNIVTPMEVSSDNIDIPMEVSSENIDISNEVSSDDITEEKSSDDTQKEVSSDDTQKEVSSDDTLIKVSWGDPPKEVSSGDPPKEVSSGDPPKEVSSGDPPKEVSSGDLPKEVSSDDTHIEVSSDEPPKDVSSGVPPKEVSSDDALKEVSSGDPPKEVSSDLIPSEISSDAIPSEMSSDAIPSEASSDERSKEISSESISKEVSSDIGKDASSDDISKEISLDDMSKDVSSDDISKEVSSDDISKEISLDDMSKEVSPDDISKEVSSDDISKEVSPDISNEVSQDISNEVSPDISKEVSPDISKEVFLDISKEVSPDDISMDDISKKVSSDDISKEVSSDDIPKEVSSGDISKDVSSGDVSKEASLDDTPKEVSSGDISKDVSSDDVSKEVSSDCIQDITKMVASNDISKEVSSDIAKEVSSDIAKEVSSDIAKEVSSDIAKEVSSDIAKEVSSDIAKEVVSDDISKGFSSDDISKGFSSDNMSKEASSDISKEDSLEDISKEDSLDDISKEVSPDDISKEVSLDNISKEASSDISKEDSLDDISKDDSLDDISKEVSPDDIPKEVSSLDTLKEASSGNIPKEVFSDDTPKEILSENTTPKDIQKDDSAEKITPKEGFSVHIGIPKKILSENIDIPHYFPSEISHAPKMISTTVDIPKEVSESDNNSTQEQPLEPKCAKEIFPDTNTLKDVSEHNTSIPMEVSSSTILDNPNEISPAEEDSKVLSEDCGRKVDITENVDMKNISSEDVDMEDVSSDIPVSTLSDVQKQDSSCIISPQNEESSTNTRVIEVSSDNVDNQKGVSSLDVAPDAESLIKISSSDYRTPVNEVLLAAENTNQMPLEDIQSTNIISSEKVDLAIKVPSPMGKIDLIISEDKSVPDKIPVSENVAPPSEVSDVENVVARDVQTTVISSESSNEIKTSGPIEIDSSVSHSSSEEKPVANIFADSREPGSEQVSVDIKSPPSSNADKLISEEPEIVETKEIVDDEIHPICSVTAEPKEPKLIPQKPTLDEVQVESTVEKSGMIENVGEDTVKTAVQNYEEKQTSGNSKPETQTPGIPDLQTSEPISSIDATKPEEVIPSKPSLGGLVGYEYSSSDEEEPDDSVGRKAQLISSDGSLKRKAESPLESVSKIPKIGENNPPVVPFNPIVGETIEEDVMTIEGLGSGAANEGGNNEQEVEATETIMQEENEVPTPEVEVKKRGRGRPKKNPGTPGTTPAPRGRPVGSGKRTNSDHSSANTTPTTPATPRVRKRELENLNISFEGSSEMNGGDSINDRPVRASRRIAQIRQKEEEERRQLEEEKLAQLKAAQIRKQQKLLEKKKAELSDGEIAQPKIKKLPSKNKNQEYLPDPESDSDSDEAEGEGEDGEDYELKPSKLKKRRRKRNKNGKTKRGGNPWGSSSSEDEEAVEEEEEYHYEEEEEDLVFNKSDHEFSPESDLGDEDEASPSRHARTAKRGEEIVDKYAETYCDKCGKGDHPEWILLCDMCDKGWHASCIRPQLWVIPEGQWFCPPCQHNTLIEKLNENLIEYEKILKRRENEVLRKQRLAYVGISLDNVLPGGAPILEKEEKEYFIEKTEKQERQERYNQRERKSKSRRRRIDSDDDDEELEGGDDFINDDDSDKASRFNSSAEESDEPIYKLRARRATKSFNFKEYDEMINSALRVDDDVEIDGLETAEVEKKPEASNGKGKSMGDDEESEEQESDPGINVGENGVSKVRKRILMSAKRTSSDEPAGKKMLDEDTDEEELDEKEKNRRKELLKHSQRKTRRRLNDLDAPSDEDEDDSDEDFQGSGGDDEDEDEEEAVEDDSEWSGDREADESDDSIQRGARNKTKQGRLGRKEKYLEVGSVRRSTRRRKARISYDESDEDAEEDGSDKWQSDETEESESNSESDDETWGKKKKRKTFNPPKSKFFGNPFQAKPKPKKKKKKVDDDDVDRPWSSNASKKKSAEEPVERRTRGRKINFKDILDSGESDDDGNIRPKRRRILSDSDSDSDAPTSSRKLIEEIKAQNAREAAMHAAKSILADEKQQLEEKQAAAAASAVVLPEPKATSPPPVSVPTSKTPSLVPPPLQSDSSAGSSKGRSRSSSPGEKSAQIEMEMAMAKPVPAPPFPPALAKALGRKSTPSPATLASFSSTIDNNINLLPPLGQPLPAHPPVSLSSSPTHPLQLSHSPSNSPSSLTLSLPLTSPPSQTPPPPTRGSKKNNSLNVPTPPKGSLPLPPAALTPPKPPISPHQQQTLPPGIRANLPSDIARLGNPAALYSSNAPLRPFHPAWRSSVPTQYGNPGAGMPNTSIGKPPPLSGPPFNMSQQGPPRSGYPSPPPLRIPNPGNSPLQAFQQFKRDALPPGMPMYRMPPSTQQGGGPLPGILPPNMAALNQGPPDRYFGGPPGSYGHPPYGLPPPHNQSQPPSIFPPFDYRIQHLQRPSEPFKDEPPPAQSQPPANEPPSSPPPASTVTNATKEEPPGSQGDGEFGGLVSYFSSQRSNEEDLDT